MNFAEMLAREFHLKVQQVQAVIDAVNSFAG